MLIQNANNTFTAGPFDVLLILYDVDNGTYHPAFFEEAPMPGPVLEVQEVEIVRLRSKMHHTTGARTIEDAQVLFDELATQIEVRDENRWKHRIVPWDGVPRVMLLERNWLRRPNFRVTQLSTENTENGERVDLPALTSSEEDSAS